MNEHDRRRGPWAVAIILSLVAAAAAVAGTPQGQAAANEVSQASYIDLMDNWLYTHVGDDRGFGPEHDLARDNIAMLMQSYGLTVTLEPFTYSTGTYYNVVGTKVGTALPNQLVVLGAHFDSVGNPGADDDASGVALVLEVARIVSAYDSDYTIRFVAFDREEQGLVGSNAYVDGHMLDDVVAMLQADMVAYDPGTDVARLYTRGGPLLASLIDAVDSYSGGLTWLDSGWTGSSDHVPFDAAGYDAALLIESEVWSNPFYHSAADNFENPDNLNFEYATRMTRTVAGWITDAAGVQVPADAIEFSYPGGRPFFIHPAGGTTMQVAVAAVGAAVHQPGTGLLHVDTGSGWQSAPMTLIATDLYEAVFPAVLCTTELRYYVTVESTGAEAFADPYHAPADSYAAMAAMGEIVMATDDFEADNGWTVAGDASAGQWQRGMPVGGGDRGDPPTDLDGSGQCYLTGNTDGDSDVDGGTTILTSPAFDLEGTDAYVEYGLWYTNSAGADPNNDLFHVRLSDDDGASWVLAETVGPVTGSGWSVHAIRVAEFVSASSTVRVRFEASDLNAGSVVEAGVDALRIMRYDCAAPCLSDINGDGAVDVTDLLQLLGDWGQCAGCASDIDGSGTVDTVDLLALLAAWGPCA